MKILIIGGTSSLGLALKPILEQLGEVITAGRKNCDIDIDLSRDIDVTKFPKDIDIVLHSAAHFGGDTFRDIEQAININVLGILRVCEVVKQLNIKHFILISSIFACLDDKSKYYTSYALTKKQSEEIATFFCFENNINLTILRPSQIYGNSISFAKHQPFMYNIIEKAKNDETIYIYGSNDALRNYIHINDLTTIISKVIEKTIIGVYYCGYMTDIKYSQVAKAAFNAFNHEEKITFLLEKSSISDNIFNKDDSLYRKIDFYPNISIEIGMNMIASITKKKIILVSGASGIVGYGILKSLKSSNKELTLIGTTIYNDSVAEGFCDIFVKAPPTNSDDYIQWIIDTIKKYKIDLIVPGIEADMYKWAENKDLIEQTGTKILINNLNLIELCKDKWEFYKYMKIHNLPFIIESSLNNDFEILADTLGMPMLAKPRCGFGSKGIIKIENIELFKSIQKTIGTDTMIQEYIGSDDEEYSTSAFCDGRGSYSGIITLKRKLSKDGFTQNAEVIDLKEINNAVSILCDYFKPIGPTNFQFRKYKDEVKLLEINPRISSATSIRSSFGYNESSMSIDFFLDNKIIERPLIKKGRAVRYVEDFIFYE